MIIMITKQTLAGFEPLETAFDINNAIQKIAKLHGADSDEVDIFPNAGTNGNGLNFHDAACCFENYRLTEIKG